MAAVSTTESQNGVRQLLHADYVVFGAGAMGMAFVDTLLTETNATVVLVDKHGQPGGHWNDAYPFVRLHQPSAYYGVNSKCLERKRGDYLALASRNEILAYYEDVISKFVASGRVQYFPMCQSDDPSNARTFHSLVQEDKSFEVASNAKIVNATYLTCVVPSISPAECRYDIADGVRVVPLNSLPHMGSAWSQYVIVGSGKTGIDAALWLLNAGVDSSAITWISPNDSWFTSRTSTTPDGRIADVLDEFEAMSESKSVEELYDRLEKAGFFHRIDPSVRPTKNKCGTVSTEEMDLLRTIQVVRLGRVKRIEQGQVILQKGAFATRCNALYVDCSTDGLAPHPAVPVFQDDKIILQSVFMCQQVFSAAVIAHIEAMGGDTSEKNALCAPVPHPVTDDDLVLRLVTTLENKAAWRKAGLNKWLNGARLNSESHNPSCFSILKFLYANLGSLYKLIKGPAKIESLVLENMRKLAAEVQSRQHPTLLTATVAGKEALTTQHADAASVV